MKIIIITSLKLLQEKVESYRLIKHTIVYQRKKAQYRLKNYK